MSLQTITIANNKLNIFWREVVLSDDAPVTEHRPANETVRISIDSKLEHVEMVEAITQCVAAKMDFDEDDASWIELAVHEAVVNAIKHGNQYLADKQIDVQLLIEPDALNIYVRDRGAGFDPARLLGPLEPENLLNPSGRGILWMCTFMDEVEYSAHHDGGCVVRMKKYQGSSRKPLV